MSVKWKTHIRRPSTGSFGSALCGTIIDDPYMGSNYDRVIEAKTPQGATCKTCRRIAGLKPIDEVRPQSIRRRTLWDHINEEES